MKIIDRDILRSRITAHAEQDLAEGKIGGAELIVNQNGERVFHETFGTRSVGGAPLEKGLLYRAASMTKPITGVAVMCLVDQGKLDLDRPVGDFFPCLYHAVVGKFGENEQQILPDRASVGTMRVYQLLSHCSGISYDEQWAPYHTLAEVVDAHVRNPLYFDPNTSIHYSTVAFDVAARIIELITDQSYDEFLHRYVLDPLGMKDTTFDPTPEQWSRMITMHSRGGDGKSYDSTSEIPGCVFADIPASTTAAGAAIATTAEDYSRFAEMLVHEGVGPDGTRILSEAAVRNMRTPHVSQHIMPDPGDQLWGLSMRVVTRDFYPHGLKCGCYGWSGAYGSHFWVDPNNNITAIYMKNSHYDGGAGNRTACVFEEDVSASIGDFPLQ